MEITRTAGVVESIQFNKKASLVKGFFSIYIRNG